jgi:DNA modification methylase
MRCHTSVEGRNLTNVWNVPMGQTTKDHHAVFPAALVERPIAMTCPEFVTEQGPRRRIIGWVEYKEGSSRKRLIGKCKQVEHNEHDRRKLQERSGRQDTARRYTPRRPVTEGWTCADLPVTRRGIVLDPFAGTGTTGEVAIKLGRDFVGIELYDEYATIAEQRCREAAVLRSRYESGHESNDELGGSPCDPGTKDFWNKARELGYIAIEPRGSNHETLSDCSNFVSRL